jgi:chemotaxis protein methyltransferase CheR
MALSKEDFDYIRALLRRHTAVVLEPGKEYLVDTRLIPILRKLGLGSIRSLVERLKSEPFNGLHEAVVEALLTSETWFFRDYHPFEILRKYVIPELARDCGPLSPLRIWSAACAGGQEPYSIAMTLLEMREPGYSWPLEMVASDLSEAALDYAREGRYTQFEINRGLPAPLLVKYFEKATPDWVISSKVKGMVQFRKINLIEPWPLPKMDLIFLRNVLIYFDVETKKEILARIRKLLKPTGYLFLGGVETTLNLDPFFERISFDGATCYRLSRCKDIEESAAMSSPALAGPPGMRPQ